MNSAFNIGTTVWIKRLNRAGCVEAHRGEKAVIVRCGSIQVLCRIEEISIPEKSFKKKNKKAHTLIDSEKVATPPEQKFSVPLHLKRKINTHKSARVDLHGLTVIQALNKFESAVNAAICAGSGRLEVVHGLGSGALKEAVHTYCSTSEVIAQYSVDPQNPGLTWIYFYLP